MSYADPQEFYPHHRRVEEDFYGGGGGGGNGNGGDGCGHPYEVADFDRTKIRQSIYTIPGYIAYSMSHNNRHMPPDVSINLKGVHGDPGAYLDEGHNFSRIAQVDNYAFHAQEVSSHKDTPPRLPDGHPTMDNTSEKVYTPSSQSTDATLEKKSRIRWTLRFIRAETGDRRSCVLQCILVLAILLLLAAVGVALYFIVGGGMEHFMLNKNEPQHQEQLTGDAIIDGTFRISSVAFDADLNDPSSMLYDILRREISQALMVAGPLSLALLSELQKPEGPHAVARKKPRRHKVSVDSVFNNSSVSQYYNRSQIMRFRNGSVIVDIRVFLRTPLLDSEAKVTSAFVKGLINMHGTILLDKFVIDIRSITFKVTPSDDLRWSTSSTSHPMSTPPTTTTMSSSSPSTSSPEIDSVSRGVTSSTSTIESWSSSSSRSIDTSAETTGVVQRPPPQRNLPPFVVSQGVSTTREVSERPSTSRPSPPSSVPVTLSPKVVSAVIAAAAAAASSPSASTIRSSVPKPPPFHLRPPQETPERPYVHRHFRPTLPSHLETDFADSPGWGPWANWSPCGGSAGQCESGKNDTQTRTRDCRSRSGRGEALSDARECLKRGGPRLERRTCQCSAESQMMMPRLPSIPAYSPFSAIEQNTQPIPEGRPCHECTAGEICLAKHAEKDPICRKVKDTTDVTDCGGWCDATYEYCQHLSTGARKCIDDRECLPDEWKCGNGLCIPLEKRCDGHFNCYDTTDEQNCKCDDTQFRCGKNTSCLPLQKRCNRVVDCWDGSDEENCTKQCPDGKFTCNEGQCIPNMYFCDGFNDCADGSDEPDGCNVTFCIRGEFRCANGRCLKSTFVCDGSNTCGDGSDEVNCETTTTSNAAAVVVRPMTPLELRSELIVTATERRDQCLPNEFRCKDGSCNVRCS